MQEELGGGGFLGVGN